MVELRQLLPVRVGGAVHFFHPLILGDFGRCMPSGAFAWRSVELVTAPLDVAQAGQTVSGATTLAHIKGSEYV